MNWARQRHIAELRPDLRLFSADIMGSPEKYPPNCQFHQADLQRDRLPWAEGSMAAITCMHLVEHLNDLNLWFQEVKCLLKPGGRAYFETPHPKTLAPASPRGQAAGTSRNRLFAASHLFYQFLPPSRQKYTARVHWPGWSAYLMAHRPS